MPDYHGRIIPDVLYHTSCWLLHLLICMEGILVHIEADSQLHLLCCLKPSTTCRSLCYPQLTYMYHKDQQLGSRSLCTVPLSGTYHGKSNPLPHLTTQLAQWCSCNFPKCISRSRSLCWLAIQIKEKLWPLEMPQCRLPSSTLSCEHSYVRLYNSRVRRL